MNRFRWAALLLLPSNAFAFPQLTRHGYFNCTACHVSPAGGGQLTEYGRGLSAELLSTWSRAGEEKPFYGLLPDSKNFTVAGYVRALQLYTDNVVSRDARAILMQADLEAGLHVGPFTAVGSVGRREVAEKGGPEQDQVFSRTHYLLYSSESGVNVRAGKFLPYWGLNHPNHDLLVRRDLGFGDNTERYTAESSYLTEGFSVFASHVFGPGGDSHAQSKEEANTLSVNKAIGESNRLGAGWYRGRGENARRTLWNVNGLIAWTKNLFSLFEADYQRAEVPAATKGAVATHQLGWEIVQGVVPYAELQWENLKLPDSGARITTWGLGANWYPRPHLEFQLFGGRESRAVLDTTVAYAMVNLYL